MNTNLGRIVQSLPSPNTIREDENVRQTQGGERYTKAAEQNKFKIGGILVKEDLIGPQPR